MVFVLASGVGVAGGVALVGLLVSGFFGDSGLLVLVGLMTALGREERGDQPKAMKWFDVTRWSAGHLAHRSTFASTHVIAGAVLSLGRRAA